MELHAVRSEVTSELKALQDDQAEGGDAKSTPKPALFHNARVLELGCGVGLVSLVAASVGADTIATDSDVTALTICSRNAHGNRGGLQGGIRVRHLDWTVLPQLTAPEAAVPATFLWTEDDQDGMSKLDMIVCSDVFYDDELTELLLGGLHALMLRFPRARVFITAERRVVFSMYTLSEIALGYDTFQAHRCLHPSNQQESLSPSVAMCSNCGDEQAKERFIATNTPLDDIPHVFQYDRVSTLEMWEVKAVVTSRTDILV
ncbi:hypothetical protein Poli38472_008689 [Pythium oligandrum]|uniref:Calmodulin-lysine N-methyltransferase n=1 Tax=Pythium oligandrum TaxID=41045 RepID=A0A8K1FBE6_PYTOL|nr:hypothetical protein Poli38472_008689 [Pythium oligandrum]|eukprot:TMW56041.1 hypothetical protein Poli38472_008689 [Pythium oligandrum]